MTQAAIDAAIAALDWPIQARDENFVEVHKNVIAVALACLRDYVPREDREQILPLIHADDEMFVRRVLKL